jgi:hypothetical protein
MNRVKKEEKKRGKPFPSGTLSSEEWNKMVIEAEENPLRLCVPNFMKKDLEPFKKLVKEKSGK